MKRTILACLVLLLFAASCSKNSTAGGTWTFYGNSYTATTCISRGNFIAASSSSNSNINYFGGVTVYFSGPTLPTTSGTYTVVDTNPIGNQVIVSATVGGVVDTAYNSIDSGQTVAVIVSNGKLKVSGTNINLGNKQVTNTTYPLTFNIYN